MTTHRQETDISGKAMLVSLRVSSWTARTLDKAITEEINRQHGASSDAGNYWKKLMPARDNEYKALMQHINVIRSDYYAQTLAWDPGWRLLPTANYMEFAGLMRAHSYKFRELLDGFVAAYGTLMDSMRNILNGMWNAADYPGPNAIRNKFNMALDYAPLPTAGDFRLTLPAEEMARIGANVEDRVTRATRDAMRDAWGRLLDTVTRMQERLATPDAIFRDSLVGNVRELVDILARLNVTNDPDLEGMRQRVKTELTAYTPETLRNDPDVRQDAANKAQAILDAMQGLMGGTP